MQVPNFQEYAKTRENFNIYIKVLSWAHLNFQLQETLQKEELSEDTKARLFALGFRGDLPKLSQELFSEEGFCSSSQTSKRIASFALKEVGLDIALFEQAEEGIQNAYADVQKESNRLLQKSLEQTLETLSVFKP
jgi:hypothetical protein